LHWFFYFILLTQELPKKIGLQQRKNVEQLSKLWNWQHCSQVILNHFLHSTGYPANLKAGYPAEFSTPHADV
jgi:hypothetical protein